MLPVRGKEPLVSPAFHFWISNERFYDGSWGLMAVLNRSRLRTVLYLIEVLAGNA